MPMPARTVLITGAAGGIGTAAVAAMTARGPHVTAVGQLHDTAAVLVVDETGDLKKGAATVGVQRQYTGTAGRIENSQVAVYLTYSTRRGHAAIDRELYVPRSWTEDTARCQAAGIPDTVGFATKPALAARMIGRALDAGVPASWVAGDEVYGATLICGPHWSNGKSVTYSPLPVTTRSPPTQAGSAPTPWSRGCRGGPGGNSPPEPEPRATAFTTGPWPTSPNDRPGHHQLLVRRNRRTGELAFYRCSSATHVSLSTLVQAAGRRWTVEETFQSGQGLAGLDEHQVRRWTTWHRWVTLAMLAQAFLAVVRADEHARHPGPGALIPLTCHEIQRLFNALVVRLVHDTAHRLLWPQWRRRHQTRTQTSHHQQQTAQA